MYYQVSVCFNPAMKIHQHGLAITNILLNHETEGAELIYLKGVNGMNILMEGPFFYSYLK